MSERHRGPRNGMVWHDEVGRFRIPSLLVDQMLDLADGTTAWHDEQARWIASILGDEVLDAARGALVHLKPRAVPRPVGHVVWFEHLYADRYTWPSCLVWVPVETAAVLAAPLEPIDLDAVKVHTRVRQGLPLRLPDFTGLRTLRMPDLPNLAQPRTDYLRALNIESALSPALEDALEGVVEHLQAALPEGIGLRPEMVEFGPNDILSNETTVRLIPEAVEAEMQLRFDEQKRRIEHLFPDL